LHVPIKTDAKSVSLFQVSESKTADLEVASQDIELDHALESNNLKLTFKGIDKDTQKLNFEVYDKISETTELFDFGMGFWQSYYKQWDGAEMNSGAYVFRQMSEQYFPMSYGAYESGKITLGDSIQQMDFTFGEVLYHETSESMQSSVHFTLDKELGLIRINVQLQGLPFSQVYNGYEVVPQFHVRNFDNNKTFYTDSNGLEMQERILNYRPTWDLHTSENVTSNYYPINSAISMKDISSFRQFTVMNDRSQGGTSISEGTIELMQNRETPGDDNKGVGEPLEEKNEYGTGMKVTATYYVQICDGVKR